MWDNDKCLGGGTDLVGAGRHAARGREGAGGGRTRVLPGQPGDCSPTTVSAARWAFGSMQRQSVGTTRVPGGRPHRGGGGGQHLSITANTTRVASAHSGWLVRVTSATRHAYRAASAPAAPASCSRPQPPANPRRGGVIRAAMLGGQRPVRAEWVGARTHRIAEHVQHEEPGRGGQGGGRGGGRRGRLLAAEARGPFAGAAAAGHRLAVFVFAVEGGGRRWHAVEGGWFGECRQGQDGSVTREGCAIAQTNIVI